MKKLLWVFLLLPLLWIGVAQAETCDATGCTYTASWTEPTTFVPVPPATTGLPLTNLTKTSLYIQVGVQTPTKIDFAASKPAGGGAMTTTFKVGVLPGQNVSFKCWNTATNSYGESAKGVEVAKVKDRTAEVLPETPANLVIN